MIRRSIVLGKIWPDRALGACFDSEQHPAPMMKAPGSDSAIQAALAG